MYIHTFKCVYAGKLQRSRPAQKIFQYAPNPPPSFPPLSPSPLFASVPLPPLGAKNSRSVPLVRKEPCGRDSQTECGSTVSSCRSPSSRSRRLPAHTCRHHFGALARLSSRKIQRPGFVGPSCRSCARQSLPQLVNLLLNCELAAN